MSLATDLRRVADWLDAHPELAGHINGEPLLFVSPPHGVPYADIVRAMKELRFPVCRWPSPPPGPATDRNRAAVSEPLAERHRYYNPVLDPHCIAKMTPAMQDAVADDAYENGGPLNQPDDDHPANLVSSLCADGWHRPALDIDIACELVPSATPGHSHLYFPTLALSWDAYVELLTALAVVGIIEERYAKHSITRGQTLLRPPGVVKFRVGVAA